MFKSELLLKYGDTRNSANNSVEGISKSVKDAFKETTVAILGMPPKHSSKEWLSAIILELSDEKRRLKGIKLHV